MLSLLIWLKVSTVSGLYCILYCLRNDYYAYNQFIEDYNFHRSFGKIKIVQFVFFSYLVSFPSLSLESVILALIIDLKYDW